MCCPGPTELPSFRVHHTETLSPHSAHGIKGVGEGGAIAPAGAIVNAINDALAPLGAMLRDIPASPIACWLPSRPSPWNAPRRDVPAHLFRVRHRQGRHR